MITKRIDMRPAGGVLFQVLRDGAVVWEDVLNYTGSLADRDAGAVMRSYVVEMERQAKAFEKFCAFA